MVQAPTQPETLLLELPLDLQLSVSLEQFAVLAASNRELQLERTAKGELIVNPPTGWETGKRNFALIGQLYRWHEGYQQGEAFDSSAGFTLPNGAILSPDVCWVSPGRWDALTDEERGTFPQVCPDFVVELRSASDSLQSLQAKMQEYLENGAKLGWLIDPQNQIVEVYRAGLAVEVLAHPVQLSGEDVLPGFVLNLGRVWG